MKASDHSRKLAAAVVSACILTAVIAGCGQGQGEAGGTDQQRGQVEQETKKPAEISMMLVQHNANPPRDTLIAPLEELTGTKLKLSWVPDNVYSDQLFSAIASRTLPKVVNVKSVDIRHPTIVNAIRSDMFWEIGPYLNSYPNISKFMNPTIMQNAMYFGKYYGIYRELPLSRQGIQFRKDWLNQLGLQEPKTIEDLYEVMKAFTYGDPDGNGKQDTYGLADRNDLVYGAFKNLATYFGTPNNWGLVDGRLTPEFMTKEYMETMKFMKRLYEEKLMNSDFTITSKVQQEEKFIRGEAGMMITNLVAASIRDRIQKVQPKAEVDIVNRIQGPQGERVWGGTGLGGLFLFPKSAIKNEDELREVLQFFELTLTEEVNNLITYGIEDRHYQKQPDGTIKVFPDTKALRLEEVEVYANTLRTFDIYYLKQGEVAPLESKINRLIADNQSIVVHDPTVGLISAAQAESGPALSLMITEATYDFILGKLDEAGFKRVISEWRKNGGDRIIEEMNQEFAGLNK
jgi:putative aldouronate transport system substrate-binding protein